MKGRGQNLVIIEDVLGDTVANALDAPDPDDGRRHLADDQLVDEIARACRRVRKRDAKRTKSSNGGGA